MGEVRGVEKRSGKREAALVSARESSCASRAREWQPREGTGTTSPTVLGVETPPAASLLGTHTKHFSHQVGYHHNSFPISRLCYQHLTEILNLQ